MQDIFTSVIFISLAGAIAAVAVMVLRQTARRIPVRVLCLLWLLVGLRLVVPFSPLSWPGRTDIAADIPAAETTVASEKVGTGAAMSAAEAQSAIGALPVQIEDNAPSAESSVNQSTTQTVSDVSSVSVLGVLAVMWAAGAAAVLCIAAVSYIRMYLRLRTAVRCTENIYRSELIASPFVFGIAKPKIYIPCSLDEEHVPYVLHHERTHILRHDHIVKAAAIVIAAVHWFNPFVWAAYFLMCRDMEKACDVQVISEMNREERRRYSTALLCCSIGGKMPLCPVGFGDVSVKERIVNIMKYNSKNYLSKAAVTALCIIAAVSVLVLPVGCAEKEENIPAAGIIADNASAAAAEGRWEIEIENHRYKSADGSMSEPEPHNMDADGVCTVCGGSVHTTVDGETTISAQNSNGDPIVSRAYAQDGTLVHDWRCDYEYDEDGNNISDKMYEFDRLIMEIDYKLETLGDGTSANYASRIATCNEDGTVLEEYNNAEGVIIREIRYDAEGSKTYDYYVISTYDADGRPLSIEKFDGEELAEKYVYEYNEDGVQTALKIYRDGRLAEESFYAAEKSDNGEWYSYVSKTVEYDENGNSTVTFEQPEGTVGAAG